MSPMEAQAMKRCRKPLSESIKMEETKQKRDKRITIRLSSDEVAHIRRIATQFNTTPSEAVRILLQKHVYRKH